MREQEVEEGIKEPTASGVERKRPDTCEQTASSHLGLVSNPLNLRSVKANMLIEDRDERYYLPERKSAQRGE